MAMLSFIIYHRKLYNIVKNINVLKTSVSLTWTILTIRRKISQPGWVYCATLECSELCVICIYVANVSTLGIVNTWYATCKLWMYLWLLLLICIVFLYLYYNYIAVGIRHWSKMLCEWSTDVSRRGSIIRAT